MVSFAVFNRCDCERQQGADRSERKVVAVLVSSRHTTGGVMVKMGGEKKLLSYNEQSVGSAHGTVQSSKLSGTVV